MLYSNWLKEGLISRPPMALGRAAQRFCSLIGHDVIREKSRKYPAHRFRKGKRVISCWDTNAKPTEEAIFFCLLSRGIEIRASLGFKEVKQQLQYFFQKE